MKYNKLLVVSMAAVLSLSLAGCSSSTTSTSSSNNNATVAVKELKGEELNKFYQQHFPRYQIIILLFILKLNLHNNAIKAIIH